MKTMIQDQWNIIFDVSTLYNISSHERNSISKQNITDSCVCAAYIFIYKIIFSKQTTQPNTKPANKKASNKQRKKPQKTTKTNKHINKRTLGVYPCWSEDHNVLETSEKTITTTEVQILCWHKSIFYLKRIG